MLGKVILKVVRGKLKGQEFVFTERDCCILGRALDCKPRLPNDEDHLTISRHHCLLDINPPDIRIRDFGSKNGTFVNAQKIGQRGEDQNPEEGARILFPEYDLQDGDEIELGETLFQVSIFMPIICVICGIDIPEEQKNRLISFNGNIICEKCHQKRETIPDPEKSRMPWNQCARCGMDVSLEIGKNRHGDFLCAQCRQDPLRIAEELLDSANEGEEELLGLRGYRLMRQLGRGGMGAVFLIHHEICGESHALKIILPQISADSKAKMNFLREVMITKELKHRNVVRLFDAGSFKGTFFFTMQFCDSGAVENLIKARPGPLPIEEAVRITLQALEGLEFAHNVFGIGNGVVHRDIKPSNIFLAGSGPNRLAKVGDFGIAKAFDQAGLSGMTRTGSIMGTPYFMSRQQIINFKYAKPDVDVWAMAASLYFMLTCQPPREFIGGKDYWQILLQTSAVPIRQRNPSIPPMLAEVIDEALIDNPEITFKSASLFAKALEKSIS